MKKGFCILIVALVFGFMLTTVIAQTTPEFIEFPIAIGEDSTFALGAAFDGTNYLLGIQGDTLGSSNITAQLVSQSGTLVGSRISLGRAGIPFPDGGPCVVFDGINYLIVWVEDNTLPNVDIYGQFISLSGNLIGAPFHIAATVNDVDLDASPCMAFGDTTYLVPWTKNDSLFGQLVSRSGNLIGTEIFISDSTRMPAIAFDGTNYLIAWVDVVSDTDRTISGQLISKQGTLVGTNFLIDGSSNPSDNPLAVCFDGSRYLVAFHEGVISNEWDLFARFVTTSGTVAERITITDEPGYQFSPFIAFDGTNYLITWTNIEDTVYCKGRFFNTSGVPIDTVFTIFGLLGDKIPFFAGTNFGSYQYGVFTTRVIIDTTGGGFEFTDGDVYGTFIPPCTGIEEKTENILDVSEYKLQQNAPNLFRYQTDIRYQIVNDGFVNLSVYNVAGQKVITLIDNYVRAGIHSCSWNGRDDIGEKVSSGVYFVKLKMENIELIREIMLVK